MWHYTRRWGVYWLPQSSGSLATQEERSPSRARSNPTTNNDSADGQLEFYAGGQNAADLGLTLEPGGGVNSVNIDIVNLNGANVQMPEAGPPVTAAAPVTEEPVPVGVPPTGFFDLF